MENMTNGTTMGIDWSSKPVVKEPKRVKLLNNWILSGITIIAIDSLTHQPVRGWIAIKTLPLQEGADISVDGHGVCILGTPRIPKHVIPTIDNWILEYPGQINGFYSGTRIVYRSESIIDQCSLNEHGYVQHLYPGTILQDEMIGPIVLGTCMPTETAEDII